MADAKVIDPQYGVEKGMTSPAAVLGDGHFLGGQYTLDAMERDYFYPTLVYRKTPKVWEDKGGQGAWSRANTRAR